MSDKKQIGKILLRQRALTPEQLDRALAEQKGDRLASRLAAEGTISDVAALKALSEQHGIPGIDLTQLCLKLDDLGWAHTDSTDTFIENSIGGYYDEMASGQNAPR